MKEVFTVRRNRGSVTQGTATVLLNGQEVITFGDNITLTESGQTRGAKYGEVIGGWQSDKRDEDFIKGVIKPFCANAEAIKNRIAEIIG
jgi:hypothetical protein